MKNEDQNENLKKVVDEAANSDESHDAKLIREGKYIPAAEPVKTDISNVSVVYFDREGSIAHHINYESVFLPRHEVDLLKEAESKFKKPEDWSFFIRAWRNGDADFIFTKLIR